MYLIYDYFKMSDLNNDQDNPDINQNDNEQNEQNETENNEQQEDENDDNLEESNDQEQIEQNDENEENNESNDQIESMGNSLNENQENIGMDNTNEAPHEDIQQLNKENLESEDKNENNLDPNNDSNDLNDSKFKSHDSLASQQNTYYAADWVINKLIQYNVINDKDDPMLTPEILEKIEVFFDDEKIQEIYFCLNPIGDKMSTSFNIEFLNVFKSDRANFAFFIKKDLSIEYNAQNIDNYIVTDYFYGNIKENILKIMNYKYIPHILNELKWPDGIKKDLITNTHKFMINLSNSYYTDQRQIVLYIPIENLEDSESVLKDKDLVSRLDMIMIEWANQIRDFISSQETITNREDQDILNEIDFWELRSMNLTGISQQLQNRKLNQIVNILTKSSSQSDNLNNFNSYRRQILKEKKTAEDILKFIKILSVDCKSIMSSAIPEIPTILNNIMNKVRVIIEFCSYYNTVEKLSELLKKISIQLMHSFTNRIKENMINIKESYSKTLHDDIRLIRWCIKEWKKIFNQYKGRILMFENNQRITNMWKFEVNDLQNIFYDLDSFDKRCENLNEICLCQLQFGKDKSTELPVFGGTKRYEVLKQLEDIENKFDDCIGRLIQPHIEVTDIKEGKWTEEFRLFTKQVEDLEDMYKNTIVSTFKRVKTVEEYVNNTENFYFLAKLPKIQNFIKNDIVQNLIQLLIKEIDKMKIKNETKHFFRGLRSTYEGSNTCWAKYLSMKIEEYLKLYDRLNQIFDPRKPPKEEQPHQRFKKMDELRTQIRFFEQSIKTYMMGEGPIEPELNSLIEIKDFILEEKLKTPLIKIYDFQYPTSYEKAFFDFYQCNYPSDLLRLFAINNVLSRFEEFSILPEIVRKLSDMEDKTRPLREFVTTVIREYNNLISCVKTNAEQIIFQEEFFKLKQDNISKVSAKVWNSLGNDTYLNKFRKKVEDIQLKLNKFKQNTESIYTLCDQVSKISYFHIEKSNEIYDRSSFIEEQKKHRDQTFIFIKQKAKEIVENLMKSYKNIEHVDDPEVFKGFKSYIEDISEKYFNESIEKALIFSIHSMHRAMLGYKNTNPTPFLKINILMAKGNNNKISIGNYELVPNEHDLKSMIDEIIVDMEKYTLSCPDIMKLFIEENPNFVKKIDKKSRDDKPEVLSKIPEKLDKKETKKIGQSRHKKDNKNDKRNEANLGASININLDKPEKQHLSKADDAKKAFWSEYNKNNFRNQFAEKLKAWKDCNNINSSKNSVDKEENKILIFDNFNRFLMEPYSQQYDLLQSLDQIISAPVKFKTELSGGENDSNIPETITTHFFLQFDATDIKLKLIDLCENNYTSNLEQVKMMTKSELIEKVEMDFKDHEIEFKNEPDTKEAYKIMMDKYNQCEKEKNLRFKKIEAATLLAIKLFPTTKGPGGDDLVERAQSLQDKRVKYEQLLTDTKEMLLRAKEKLKSYVLKDFRNFKSNSDEMKKEFEMNVPNKIEGKLSQEIELTNQAENILDLYYNKVKKLKEEESKIMKGLNLFKEDLGNFTIEENRELIEVEDLIKTLKVVWEIKAKINGMVYRWCHTQFLDFNLEEMKEERNSVEKELLVRCKNLNMPIYQHMVNQLENYKLILEILDLLSDYSMQKDSHWEKLANLLSEPKLTRFDLNFEQILDLKLESILDQINILVEYAKNQEQVNKSLQAMNKEWNKHELKYSINKLGEFQLEPDPKLATDLEEHLNRIAAHKATPFYDDFKTEIDNLENDLNKINDVYNLLKQVLIKWQYLKSFFSKNKDDIGHQAGMEIAQFGKDNENIGKIFDSFKEKRIVKRCFTGRDNYVDQSLNSLLLSFMGIEKALFKLLEGKRNNFERLYFISNEDFLELLGKTDDANAINQHLSKLFSGIEKINMTGKGDKKVIDCVYDSLDEKLPIWYDGEPEIKVTSVIETWMKQLERGMLETMEKNLTFFYKRGKFDFDLKEGIEKQLGSYNANNNTMKYELTGQMVMVLTQYFWFKALENEINNSIVNDKAEINYDKIIDIYSKKRLEVLAYLEDKKQKEKTKPKNKVIIYNYILTLNSAIETTKYLKSERVRSTESYDWKKLLKINFKLKVSEKKKTKINVEERFQLVAEQLDNYAPYGYEYIGNKERLIYTPITERCFLTMMTALFYNRGGMLQGPAGTGKTETIKDLSRQLAKFILVFNCSSKNNYNTMSTIFMGMLKTGAWICFDEFNRIEIEVLSVVRIQLSSIYDGLKSVSGDPFKRPVIPFKQTYVEINRDIAVFITLNPNYAGRSQLPENLKTLFRPISVVMADKIKICEMRFMAEAYQKSEDLAKTLITFYDVMEQQLSKQPHYDFSLRSIISVLNQSSSFKRGVTSELHILRLSIIDVIKPKLVSIDEEIFEAILDSVFNESRNDAFIDERDDEQLGVHSDLKKEITMQNLCGSSYMLNQCTQIINNIKFKHGIMLVGESFSGKSTALKLVKSLNKNNYKKLHHYYSDIISTTIYPKSIGLDELYGKQIGSRDDITYTEGLLPYHLKELSNIPVYHSFKYNKWLILDGTVDSLWIETLNTVLDETKMLSLPSGYRVNIKNDMKLIFEVENLIQATPATVSRVGLIYFESEKLSFFPIARNWLEKCKKKDKNWDDNIARWFDRYIYNILPELKSMNINYLFNYSDNQIVTSIIKIYESFIVDLQHLYEQEDTRDSFWDYAERLFIFSLMWAIGGGLGEESRVQLDSVIRKYCPNFPQQGLVFDYLVNPEKEEWTTWEEKMIQYWPASNTSYNEIFVPTIDTFRNRQLVQNLIKSKKNPLIFGDSSVGKSNLVKLIFKSIGSADYQCFPVQLSYGVKPITLQRIVESYFEKRNNKLFPPSNKTNLCCIEDLNLPKKDHAGSQNVIEMIRQYMENEGWHDVEKLTLTNIKSMQLVCTSTLREKTSDINQRFVSKFVPISLMNPTEENKIKIYNTIISFYLSKIANEEIKKLGEHLSHAMIGLINNLNEKENFLPTPGKSHYIFNLRDVSKIFESLSKVKTEGYSSREYFIKLWVHESMRTLSDRMLYEDDVTKFNDCLSKQLEILSFSLKECQIKEERMCIFVDFISDQYYDEAQDYEELKSKIIKKKDKVSETMVFFDQAISYICILNRLLNKGTGCHGLLIGTGANGRSVYLQIASELSGYTLKKVMLKDSNDKLYEQIENEVKNVGKNAIKTSMLIRESDINSEEVFEDINYLITTAMIPTLKMDAEEEEKTNNDKEPSSSGGNSNNDNKGFGTNISEEFKHNVRDRLKVFLSFSPIGENLRNTIRNYPGIISCTTIINFVSWPVDALIEVGKNFLDINNPDPEIKAELTIDIAEILSEIHLSVGNILQKMESEIKRKAYFTSNNYINLIKMFNEYLKFKQNYYENNINKYIQGLDKIKIGKEKINLMSIELEIKNKEEIEKQRDLEAILERIKEEKVLAEAQEVIVEHEKEKNSIHTKLFEKNLQELNKELEEVEKPMHEAKELVNDKIDRNKLAEFKGMQNVSEEVQRVFFALIAFWDKKPVWSDVKSYLQELDYDKLKDIENLPITEEILEKKVQKFSREFNLESLNKKNTMIPSLAQYIIAVEKYFKSKWKFEIKTRKQKQANDSLRLAKEKLDKLTIEYDQLKMKLQGLEDEKRAKEAILDEIKEMSIKIKEKITRANSLTEAFKTEEVRWTESLERNRETLKVVTSSTILAASILSYFGVLPTKYREELMKDYLVPIIKKKNISLNNNFDFLTFISNSRELQDWIMDELPNDNTSKENAVIIKYGCNFPLIIDPQDQAYNWIISMAKKAMMGNNVLSINTANLKKKPKKLVVITPEINAYHKTIKLNMDSNIILLNNIGENIDIEIEELLKNTKRDITKHTFYLMTKIPNPHYLPKVSGRVNIINFLVNERGLEEQVLSLIIKFEKEEMDERINKNIKSIYDANLKLEESEKQILDNLNNAEDNYLDDDQLIQVLKQLKESSIKQETDLKQVNADMEKVISSREEYRPLAKKISKIFFVLYGMNSVNKMYEFSLKGYMKLFYNSLKLSKDKGISSNESSEERIKTINKVHLEKTLGFSHQSLFEDHRLLFALQLCITHILSEEEEERKMLEQTGLIKKIMKEESSNQYFFSLDEFKILIYDDLEGIDVKGFHKPQWISDENAWKFIISLENKISDFKGIVSSFIHNSSDWNKWYERKDIENEPLPIEWEAKCKGDKNLRKLLFIKYLRPDKFTSALKNYIYTNLRITETKEILVDFKEILKELENYKPLLVIHGNGVDPSESLKKLWDTEENKREEAEKVNELGNKENKEEKKEKEKEKKEEKIKDKKKEKRFFLSTLNQDQLTYTLNEIEENSKIGGWIYLANTHLTLKNIPILEKKLDDITDTMHPDFRIIISTGPTEKYPISFLQKCEKVVYENPKGIGVNMTRLLQDLIKENAKEESVKHERADIKTIYLGKLVYSLCMFHSIVIERKKFKNYGWSNSYDFNNSDFNICYDIIKSYVKKSNSNPNDFPWKAIQELVAINYGSRFTNDKDLRLLDTYSKEFFRPKLFTDKNYIFAQTESSIYSLPDDSMFDKFKNSIFSDQNYLNKSDFYLKLCYYLEEAKKLGKEDAPEIFGLHYNAEISSQIQENYSLINNIRATSSEIVTTNSKSNTFSQRAEILSAKITKALANLTETLSEEDARAKTFNKKNAFDPINYVLVQETIKYNNLIREVTEDLTSIDQALKGNSFLSNKNENIINYLYVDKIPPSWQSYYLSTKPFGSYIIDLTKRVEFFKKWINNLFPTLIYVLGYFINPVGLITAIKQSFCLETKVSFYKVYLEFKVLDDEDKGLKNLKSDHYPISGLFIEGGVWDKKTSSLKEENIQELITPLNIVLMIPSVINENKTLKELVSGTSVLKLNFPIYYIPIRSNYYGKNTYIMDLDLPLYREKDKDGNEKPDNEILSFWIKKGTSILLSKNE